MISVKTVPVRVGSWLCNVPLNIREYGLHGTSRFYLFRLHERYRDWRLNIRTMGYIEAGFLGHGTGCNDYVPVNYPCLDRIFEYLQPEAGRDVFLDYGCGMGRAVLSAATHPFRKVIGVELSSELFKAATSNLERAQGRLLCQDVEFINGDATLYDVPDEVSVIFLFNPFSGAVLQAVQAKVAESYRRRPRRLRIVLVHPAAALDSWGSQSWLKKRHVLPMPDWQKMFRLMVYETAPQPGAGRHHAP